MIILLAVLAIAGVGGTIGVVARDGYRPVPTRAGSAPERWDST
ncbi:hypothetical protein [Cryobacterium fucosi]|nr:hypothetical protein [Cryobacterium fucosi]